MGSKNYHDLIVYEKADQLAYLVYSIASHLPKPEHMSLASQMKRTAISIPANIAEGYAREGEKDKLRFYNIAQGSLAKLEYFTEFSLKLRLLNKRTYQHLTVQRDEVERLLYGYIKSIKNKT